MYIQISGPSDMAYKAGKTTALAKQQPLNILFIDVEKYWRGSHSQLAVLMERLIEKNCNIYLICREGGALWNWAENIGAFNLIDYQVSPSFLKNMIKLLREKNIDIIHAQSSWSHNVALVLKLFNPAVSLVVSRRVDFHRRGGFINRWKYRTHKIDLWIAVSQNVKKVLIQDGVQEERIIVIHDGVVTGKLPNLWQKLPFVDRRSMDRESLNFQIQEINQERRFRKNIVSTVFQGSPQQQHHETNPSFEILKNDFLLGIVAALVEIKDHANLLRAFAAAVHQRRDMKLLIIGDGGLWGKIEELIDELHLHNHVHMMGFRTDVDSLMKLLDAFIISSYMDGLGSSLIDAMAAGLPIICTDAGGFPEIVKNGRNGIMVEKKNPTAMAQAILELAGDKKKRKEMSKNNIKDAARFDANVMSQKTWDAYCSLLNKRIDSKNHSSSGQAGT